MNLPKISDLDVAGKRVLVRLDLDTPEGDNSRIDIAAETLNFLKSKNSQIIIIGHKGRPNGVYDESLSLMPLQKYFDKWGARVEENLRFDPGEEANDPEFAKKLALFGDVYVNEAFAVSHREHASIVGLPKILPHAAGFRFAKETEHLGKEFQKPVVVLISGIKRDKVGMAKKLTEIYDKVLVGGRLPEYFGDASLESVRSQEGKLVIGNLNMDKEDITLHTIDVFKEEIKKAGTIILAGVLGKYEDEGHRQGTKEIFEAVANSSAYKIAGGGDTEAALTIFGLTDKFDWISVGGGAMLEFLANRTLPGIEALLLVSISLKVLIVRRQMGQFLKDLTLNNKITLDELQDYSQFIDSLLPRNLNDDLLLEKIKSIDDGRPMLRPIVLKLLGDLATM